MSHIGKFTGLTLLALVCAAGPRPAPGKPELVWLEKVWSSAPHNGATDLVRYKDRWYCALREGAGERSADGAIRILTSLDGEVWRSAARLAATSVDLRDPKLSVSEDGRLVLVAVEERQGIVWERHQTCAWTSSDGRNWVGPTNLAEPNVQLGRLVWHNRIVFATGYSNVREDFLRIYAAHNLDKLVALTPKMLSEEAPGQASLLFLADQRALCLAQRGAPGARAALGQAQPPYRGWIWADLNVDLECPSLLMLPDGRIAAAGRTRSEGRPRVALFWLDADEGLLRQFLELPSGGSAGAPGLAWHDGLLWVSYYSSHDGKTGIYVAKVRTGGN